MLRRRLATAAATATKGHATPRPDELRPLGAVYRFSRSHLPAHMPVDEVSRLTARPSDVVSSSSSSSVSSSTSATSVDSHPGLRVLSSKTLADDATYRDVRAQSSSRRAQKYQIHERLPRDPPAMQSIAPDLHLVPRLAHSLDHVLRSPGVHLLRDPGTQRFNFDPYLCKIHQPRELNLRALPPFTPASRDARLRQLAVEHGTPFSSSTSSISPIFAQLVHFVTRFRPLNLFSLSGPFAGMTHQSTRITTQPIVFHIRPIDSGYAVDSHSLDLDATPNNLVLIDLGKSLEAMLTMRQADFETLLVKRPTDDDDNAAADHKVPEPRDVFHYLKVGGMLLRAQLDCVDQSLPGPYKTFDIKTRATIAVRRDCGNYRRHTGYRISRLLGEYHSYEREYYDMARSAFLKYNMQVRIGRMNGVFVAFHNTQEMFGFEYLPQQDLDECLYGSTALGDRTFELVCQLTETMLRRLVADSEARAGRPVSLRCFLAPDRNNSLVHLFIEQQSDDPGWRDQVWREPKLEGARAPSDHERRMFEKMRYDAISETIKGPIGHYTLAINVLHNDKHVNEPYTFVQGDTLDLEFGWVHVGDFSPAKVSRIFWDTLRNCK